MRGILTFYIPSQISTSLNCKKNILALIWLRYCLYSLITLKGCGIDAPKNREPKILKISKSMKNERIPRILRNFLVFYFIYFFIFGFWFFGASTKTHWVNTIHEQLAKFGTCGPFFKRFKCSTTSKHCHFMKYGEQIQVDLYCIVV